ncbi:DUF2073 domain-containing protein [Candidatus Micrarchaeota archaeon]|nr:DUF2073 domain-containing protein [Candidatus Micrarchaeota archaeon]
MGIEIHFVSSDVLSGQTPKEKIGFILKEIKKTKNRILVLEGSLTRAEEKDLIAKTMGEVSKTFPGLEIASLGEGPSDFRAEIVKLLGGRPGGLTVIGPSSLVKQIKRDPDKLSLLAGK